MYKRILVAVDGSDTANLALQEAITMARGQQAMLRLIHVTDETPAYMAIEGEAVLAPEFVDAVRKGIREAGKNVLSKCSAKARGAGVEAETSMKTIDGLGLRVQDAIEEEAARWPADIIVLGTHGRRGVRRMLLGSVAEGLARIATKPVLLIRGK